MADGQVSTSRLEAKKPSELQCITLESEEILQALTLLRQIVCSCRGPNGKIKIVQNSVGGHMTMTSTSCRLFNAMSFSKPVTHLIISSVQSHLQNYKDGGHFAVLFCLNLIIDSVKLDINRRMLTELYEVMLNISLEYLSSQSLLIKRDIKMSNLKQMYAVVKSILHTKTLCSLSSGDIVLLSNLLLQAFLSSLPDNIMTAQQFSDQIQVLTLAKKATRNSTIFQGLLIEWPETPSYITKPLNVKTAKCSGSDNILVALITVSMSGDSEELGNMQYESDSVVDVDNIMLGIMKSFCDDLVRAEVGVVLCQKVVHPQLKLYLKQKGVLVIDRCGLALVNFIRDITGATPICTFHQLDVDDFGCLSTVTHQVLQNKSYLLLTASKSCVTTLVLFSPQEERLDELKVLCSTVLSTLRQLLQHPQVLMGAGCWQVHLASVIEAKVLESNVKLDEIKRKYNCSNTTILSACKVFMQSLQRVAMSLCDGETHMIDNHAHLWRIPKGANSDLTLSCACGMFTKSTAKLNFLNLKSNSYEESHISDITDDECNKTDEMWERKLIVDEFSMCVNALKIAVLTTNTMLSIGQYIHDVK